MCEYESKPKGELAYVYPCPCIGIMPQWDGGGIQCWDWKKNKTKLVFLEDYVNVKKHSHDIAQDSEAEVGMTSKEPIHLYGIISTPLKGLQNNFSTKGQ